MRLLHITPEAPGYTSGGRLGVLQTELSITTSDNTVDYIGPIIEYPELADRYNKIYVPDKSHNLAILVFNALKGITNKSYNAWKELPIDYSEYDAVILDFTKQSYILQKVNPSKLFVRVHNVEYDFSRSAYKLNKSVKNYIVMKQSHKQESALLTVAKGIVPLTEEDKQRLRDLYHINKSKVHIVPVCVNGHAEEVPLDTTNNCMIITGSLWFGGNYDGIKWFIENVFDYLTTKPKLIIAGKNPNDELRHILSEYRDRIQLIDSPEDMGPYFRAATLAIAPVFDGAGMKVKVAEALSYGLPVVGTSHALKGYTIKQGIDSYESNTKEEFVSNIDAFFSLSEEDRIAMRHKAYQLYADRYSMKRSQAIWSQMLRENQ